MRPLTSLATASVLALLQGLTAALNGRPATLFQPDRRELLQNVVTFDNYSLFINGERTMIYSGEFHPFRLPVPSLWPDVFQKIKALGLNTVSFYLHWGSLEGKSGDFNDPAGLAIEPFLQAAQDAGIYLIARPGPYISEFPWPRGGGVPWSVVLTRDRCGGHWWRISWLVAKDRREAQNKCYRLSCSDGQVREPFPSFEP